MFCLWPRDQYVGCDFKFQAPEFLLSGEVLRGHAGGAPLDEREIVLRFGFGQLMFLM